MAVPDWLTADYLKSALESDAENFSDITITKLTFEPVVAEGNNYGSILLRAKLNYRAPSKGDTELVTSLIIKAPLTQGYIEKIMEIFPDLYQKEPKFYGEFIQRTLSLTKHDLVPKFYSSENKFCVVLEDLKESGYVMVDRHKLLDFDHCKLYIEGSSKMHALSVAINKTHPELIESLTRESPEMQEKMMQSFKGMLKIGLLGMATYLEDKPNCEEYIEVLRQLDENDNCWNIYEEMDKYKDVPLKAIVQGDPWCTNMMFKYDASGRVTSVKLIDFQSLRFMTPIMEFVTFLWVSVNPEVRETKLNDLYHLYCDSLNKNLAELGCSERLPYEVMKKELTRLSPLCLTLTCFMMPFCVSDGVADMNAFFSEDLTNTSLKDSAMYKLYTGTVFSKYILQILSQIKKEGVLDYLKEKIKQLNQTKSEN